MTSPDPSVTDPMNAQGWNRYSYVGNDPLAFTDPNGFSWLSSFFHSVSNAISSAWNAVTSFVRNNPIVRAILQIAATVVLSVLLPGAGSVFWAMGGAAIATGLSGGNLGQILKASAIAGLTAAAFVGLNFVAPAQAIGPTFNPTAYAENVAGSALVGCAQSAASGGSCGSGAAAATVSAGFAPATNSLFQNAGKDIGQRIGGTILQATVGGLGSVAGGGKFANGAVTGAFQYLVTPGPVSKNPMDANNQMGTQLPPGQIVVDPDDDLRMRIAFLQAEPDPRLDTQSDTNHYAAFWKLQDAVTYGTLFISPQNLYLPERYLLQLGGFQEGSNGTVQSGVFEYIIHPSVAGEPPILTHSVFIAGKVVNGYPNRDGP